MPSSTARRRTAIAVAGSFGGPQIPSPVRRMAPKPRRLTVSSPPSKIVPLLAADRLGVVFSFIFNLQNAFLFEMPRPMRSVLFFGGSCVRQIRGRETGHGFQSAACQLELRALILGATVAVFGPRSFS